MTLLIDVFSAHRLLLKSPLLPEEKRFLEYVLGFGGKAKQKQLNAQISHHFVQIYICDLAEIDKLFLPFFKIVKAEFLIQDLISRLIVNQNKISIYDILNLGVENQKKKSNFENRKRGYCFMAG